MAFSENAKAVYNYVKDAQEKGKNITFNDIAEGTGLNARTVNGIITRAFGMKGLMERIPAEIELEDGMHKAIKLVRLTEAGMNVDIDAE